MDHIKGIIHETYKITKIISKCGVVQKIKTTFITIIIAMLLQIGNAGAVEQPTQEVRQPQPQIEKQLKSSRTVTQADQATGSSKSSSIEELQTTDSDYQTRIVDDGKQTLTEDKLSNSSIQFKVEISSGYLIQKNSQNIETSMTSNSKTLDKALEIRCGDFKSGPGARAKADAKRNYNKRKANSGIFAEAFTSEAPYTRNYGNSGSPLSDKTRVKNSDNPFQGNTDNNNPPPENGQFSASRYKGGPSPFENFEYQDPAIVAKNIEHNLPRRANKSYDKHHSCFGLPKNRNKANLEKFEGCTDDLAQSAEEVFKGSYRYERPAYIYEKEIDGKLTAVIVDAITNEYISTFNPTTSQQENLESTGNLGLDTRPSMELRLRGPKGQNYL